MNKSALVTSGRKLEGGQLYLLSVFDLEPSGVIVHAYNQITSREYMLPVLEKEVRTSVTCFSPNFSVGSTFMMDVAYRLQPNPH
jgi:hypothetical protein